MRKWQKRGVEFEGTINFATWIFLKPSSEAMHVKFKIIRLHRALSGVIDYFKAFAFLGNLKYQLFTKSLNFK